MHYIWALSGYPLDPHPDQARIPVLQLWHADLCHFLEHSLIDFCIARRVELLVLMGCVLTNFRNELKQTVLTHLMVT